MAISLISAPEPRYTGLAADVKPADAPPGSTFLETDTGARFVRDQAAWIQLSGGVILAATLTINENTNKSNIIDSAAYAQYPSISIVAEDVALTGTITVECLQEAAKNEALDASWSAIQSPPGTNVTIEVQRAIVLLARNFLKLRLKSSVNELTANKVFYMYGCWS